MDSKNRESSEFCTSKTSDAGDANKMASPSVTLNRIKTVEHELKIMEVEGAVTSEPSATIELHDDEVQVDVDVDVDSVPKESDVDYRQTALLGKAENLENRDPLVDERIAAKTEPSSDVESIGSYSGPDPMGLLERIDSTQEIDDDDDDGEEESVDEGSSTGSRRNNRIHRWQIWMKRWPWLLHEQSDGDFAFCLYCNVVINVNRQSKYIQQHNLSLYHQERENNYLAFKEHESQASESDNEVKHEFGSNDYVAAMKQRRANEVDTLNDFNWERWLKWHSWLERLQPAGTIGLCKCCNIRMNVEFVYLRKRHESSKGHCEAERQRQQPDKSSRKRKRSESPVETSGDNVSEKKSSSKKHAEDSTVVTASGSSAETGDRSDWLELLPNTSPQQCRCTVCNVRMHLNNFTRHLGTKVHCSNVNDHKKNTENTMELGIWAQYADMHPWLVADPTDPAWAYCQVCSMRFTYGHSEIKRLIHEKSERHQGNLAASQTAKEKKSATDDKVTQSEPEESEAQSESDGSDDSYVEEDDRLSTSQKSSDERSEVAPKATKAKRTVRHYSWLRYSKDRKKQMCKYCKVRFSNESSKLQHDQSEQHKKTMQQLKARKGKKSKKVQEQSSQDNEEEDEDENEEEQSNSESIAAEDAANDAEKASRTPNPTNKATAKIAFKQVPTTMQGKVNVWRSRFPWISYKRKEKRKNYGWCKLCDVSVFMPSCKFAARHQRSSRHTRLRLERKRAIEQPPSEGTATATAAITSTAAGSATLATGDAKQKAAMAELQAKYKWLEPDATDENRCYCKLCDTRLPIKVFYLRQHDGSRKHAESLERIGNNSKVTTTLEQPEPANRMDVDQDSDEALSVKSECSTEEQTMSKRSRRTMELRRILRILRESAGKRHEERSQIDMARDMICSSFDIVKRLRTLERDTELESRELPSSSMQHPCGMVASPSQPRDTIDLFFDSITQTMKSLPPDLAAEGKAKIMQYVSNLELRSIQRTASTPTSVHTETQTKEATEESSPTRKDGSHANQESLTSDEVIDADSETSSVIFEEQSDEYLSQLLLNNNNNHNSRDIGHLSEITLTTTQRNAKSSPSPPTNTNSNTTVKTTAPTINNGAGKNVPASLRSNLPSTEQVASKPESVDQLRVVPINKLTTPNQYHNSQSRNNVNGMTPTTTPLNRNGQSQRLVSPNTIVVNTPPSSNSSNHSHKNNAATTGVLRKIRLSNGTSSKVITFQTPPMAQQQHHNTQQPYEHENERQFPIRYSNAGNSPKNNAHFSQGQPQGLTQVQVLAQAQLRALRNTRPLMRNEPGSRPSHP
ncbi:protein suppressor of variegation 3-7 isoform X2 [Drosophila innubila]|uniref:protein suppressor of variegation 3-7 isoform X2 n=1 Tax=Drosophila innubila TaxID=198719 RepID=UPI00148D1820|nr:protein suppressor of variegation 3-7 isoform X2 [Drosophila innubila]